MIDPDKLRGRIIERVAAMGPDDLRVLDAITAEMPVATLRAKLEGLTRQSIQDAGTKLNMNPTTARETALAETYAALRRWAVVLGITHGAFAPSTGASGHLHAARTPLPGLAKAGDR